MASGPQNPNQAIDLMSTITVTHVVLMAVLAILMIAAILYGTKLSRRRRAAREQAEADFAIAEEHGATATSVHSLDDAPTVSADVPNGVDAPAPSPPSAETAPPTGDATDLTQIKGLGPKLAATLAERGITRVDQIAALSPAAAAELDAALGVFQGRMARDRWVEQARLLTAGDRAGYEAAFGKLGG